MKRIIILIVLVLLAGIAGIVARSSSRAELRGLVSHQNVADVRQEFGPDGWQLQEGRFCWSAVRRPTETAREIVVGRDLDHLAVKLRAWRDEG